VNYFEQTTDGSMLPLSSPVHHQKPENQHEECPGRQEKVHLGYFKIRDCPVYMSGLQRFSRFFDRCLDDH
jgi:hypothetical protein